MLIARGVVRWMQCEDPLSLVPFLALHMLFGMLLGEEIRAGGERIRRTELAEDRSICTHRPSVLMSTSGSLASWNHGIMVELAWEGLGRKLCLEAGGRHCVCYFCKFADRGGL